MDTPDTLIDRLCGTFHPLHARWLSWHPRELHLWELTHKKSEQELQEMDIRRIGLHFASADDIGARSEFALTAECVVAVRQRFAGMTPSARQTETDIDAIYHELTHAKKHEVKPPMDKDLPFEAPYCWRIAQAVVGAGHASSASLEALLTIYQDLAQLFILRDGNITRGEDVQLARYHAAFG